MKIEYEQWPSKGLLRIGFNPFGWRMVLASTIENGKKYGGLGADKKSAKEKLLEAINKYEKLH